MKTVVRSGHLQHRKVFTSILGFGFGFAMAILMALQTYAITSLKSVSSTCDTTGVHLQFQKYFERLERRRSGQYKEVQEVIFLDSLKINESKKVSFDMQDAFINNIFLGPIDVYVARTLEEPARIKNYVLVVFNNGCALLDIFELESFL